MKRNLTAMLILVMACQSAPAQQEVGPAPQLPLPQPMWPPQLWEGRLSSTEKDVTPPKAIYKPEPRYTKQARLAAFEGETTLSLMIDTSGKVTDAQFIVPAPPYGLAESALETVRKWRFLPAYKDGKAIPSWVAVKVGWRLLEKKPKKKAKEIGD